MAGSLLQIMGNSIFFAGKSYKCAVGKNGFSADKKEGDNCTPLGRFLLRECWYRADKMSAPQTSLPVKVITENDGWCDDVSSLEYNKHIKIPSPSGRGQGEGKFPRHEKLWRDDGLYDLIIPIGYNDDPVVAGKGSAIFMHVAKPDYSGTEGCVALAKNDLLELLPLLSVDSTIEIT